jgi:hypothetical protein
MTSPTLAKTRAAQPGRVEELHQQRDREHDPRARQADHHEPDAEQADGPEGEGGEGDGLHGGLRAGRP